MTQLLPASGSNLSTSVTPTVKDGPLAAGSAAPAAPAAQDGVIVNGYLGDIQNAPTSTEFGAPDITTASPPIKIHAPPALSRASEVNFKELLSLPPADAKTKISQLNVGQYDETDQHAIAVDFLMNLKNGYLDKLLPGERKLDFEGEQFTKEHFQFAAKAAEQSGQKGIANVLTKMADHYDQMSEQLSVVTEAASSAGKAAAESVVNGSGIVGAVINGTSAAAGSAANTLVNDGVVTRGQLNNLKTDFQNGRKFDDLVEDNRRPFLHLPGLDRYQRAHFPKDPVGGNYPDITNNLHRYADDILGKLKDKNKIDVAAEIIQKQNTDGVWDLKGQPGLSGVGGYAVYKGQIVTEAYTANNVFGREMAAAGFSLEDVLKHWGTFNSVATLGKNDQPEDMAAIVSGWYEQKTGEPWPEGLPKPIQFEISSDNNPDRFTTEKYRAYRDDFMNQPDIKKLIEDSKSK